MIAKNAATIMVSVLVYASGLNIRPSCASNVSTGRKETAITSSAKNVGPATSLMAPSTTSRQSPLRPLFSHSSSFLCVCSTTTMEASTSSLNAMATPASDMILALMPIMRNGMNASNTAIGMVTIGIAALGKCHRKTRMMSTTVIATSMIVSFDGADRVVNQLRPVVDRDDLARLPATQALSL